MNASDIYGKMGVGSKNTQDKTQPQKEQSASSQANDQAKGKPLSNTYGTMAILGAFGILIGAKFVLEKRK